MRVTTLRTSATPPTAHAGASPPAGSTGCHRLHRASGQASTSTATCAVPVAAGLGRYCRWEQAAGDAVLAETGAVMLRSIQAVPEPVKAPAGGPAPVRRWD